MAFDHRMKHDVVKLVNAINERLDKGRGQLSDRDVVLLNECRNALQELAERLKRDRYKITVSDTVRIVRLLIEFFQGFGNDGMNGV
jgi:hypothetical protein